MAFDPKLGYDPNKDYSLAILNASTEAQRQALRNERENKIMDMYGGIDPYKGDQADIVKGYSSGGTGGGAVTVTGAGADPAEAYLKTLYDQKTAAELASLRSTYEANLAREQETLSAIAPRYSAARGELSAATEKEKRNFAEFGAAHGLNTGASGQAELARSTVYQSDLASLYAQELSETAQSRSRSAELDRAYGAAVTQAEATGQSELARASYEEYVRKLEAEREDAARAAEQARWDREQANWETEQANWQAEFDFAREKAAAEAAAKESAASSAATAAKREEAYSLAMTLLKAGAMPGAATLAAAGISTADAKSYLTALSAAQTAVKSSSGSSKSSSSSSKSSSSSSGSGSGGTSQTAGAAGSMTYNDLGTTAKSLYTSIQTQMRRTGANQLTSQQRLNLANSYFDGKITREEYTFIMGKLEG